MIEPAIRFPFAVFGIAHMQTATPLTTRLLRGRRSLPPIRPTHLTVPCWTGPPVSLSLAASPTENGRPALGGFGLVVKAVALRLTVTFT